MRDYLEFLPKKLVLPNPQSDKKKETKLPLSNEALQFDEKQFRENLTRAFGTAGMFQKDGGMKVWTQTRKGIINFYKLIALSRKYKETLARQILNNKYAKYWDIEKIKQENQDFIEIDTAKPERFGVKTLKQYLTSIPSRSDQFKFLMLVDYVLFDYPHIKLNVKENIIIAGKQTYKMSKLMRKVALKYKFDVKAVDTLLQNLTTTQTSSNAITGLFTFKTEDFIFQSHGNSWRSCHREQIDREKYLGRRSNSNLPWMAQGADYATGMLYLTKGRDLANLISRRAIYIDEKAKTYAMGRTYPSKQQWQTKEGMKFLDVVNTQMKKAGYSPRRLSYTVSAEEEGLQKFTMKWGSANKIYGYRDFTGRSYTTQESGVAYATTDTYNKIMKEAGMQWKN